MSKRLALGVWLALLLVFGGGCTLRERAAAPPPATLTLTTGDAPSATPGAPASPDPSATPGAPVGDSGAGRDGLGGFGPIVGGPATATPPPPTMAPTATEPPPPPSPPGNFGPVIGDGAAPAPTQAPAFAPSAGVQRYTLRQDAVQFRAHPDGCAILAMAGQVYDANGAELPGQHRVHVWTDALDLSAAAGSDPRWGAAGYQIVLADQPQPMSVRLQLLDLATGAPVSEVFRVQTLARCDANHLIADFVPAN